MSYSGKLSLHCFLRKQHYRHSRGYLKLFVAKKYGRPWIYSKNFSLIIHIFFSRALYQGVVCSTSNQKEIISFCSYVPLYQFSLLTIIFYTKKGTVMHFRPRMQNLTQWPIGTNAINMIELTLDSFPAGLFTHAPDDFRFDLNENIVFFINICITRAWHCDYYVERVA